jgi:DNA invertase Pin-like site-specific DNA recombinase
MRVVLYVRVSTIDQNCELQLRELHAFAQRQGWTVSETYCDTMSAAK